MKAFKKKASVLISSFAKGYIHCHALASSLLGH